MCHWIACVWWAIGAGGDNLLASFGTSWIFREGQADCAALSDDARADAIAAVDVLADELGGTGGSGGVGLPEEDASVLRHNWRYVWCDAAADATRRRLGGGGGSGSLSADFKLWGSAAVGYSLPQMYLSSMYWSLTMLMKTPYIGPDTLLEKVFGAPRS